MPPSGAGVQEALRQMHGGGPSTFSMTNAIRVSDPARWGEEASWDMMVCS